MTPARDLDYKHFNESTVENPKLRVLVDIGKAYLMLTKYMNVGNDWKNTRRRMLTGELWAMEQSIPMAISKETRSPEIQHFPWASGKQLRSCTNLRRPPSSFCCAPTAGRGRPISQQLTDRRCKPSWPASRYRAANSGGGSTGRTRGSPSARAAGTQGACGATRVERKLLFRARLPRAALPPLLSEPLMSAPALVSTLPFLEGDFTQSDLQRCPFMLRLMAGNPMATHSSTLAWKIPWTEEPGRLQSLRLRRVGHDWSDLAVAAADGWKSEHVVVCFEIQDCFWGKGLIQGHWESHLQSGQKSTRYWDPPVGKKIGDKTET